jgi:hypothetical protein
MTQLINFQQIIESYLVGKCLTIYACIVMDGEYEGEHFGYYAQPATNKKYFLSIPMQVIVKAINFDNKELRNVYGGIALLKLEQSDGKTIDLPVYEYTNLELMI